MTEPTPRGPGDIGTMREIEERMRVGLAVLERKNQQLTTKVRILTLGFAAMVGLLLLVGIGPTLVGDAEDEVLEIRTLRILDANGLPRGEWGVDDEGASRLSLFDQRGRQRLNLTVLQSGFPGLALSNEAGQRRAVLGLLPDQTTTLVFADGKGVPRAVLGLTAADAANLVFADADGVSRMGMGLDGTGLGSLMMPQDSGSAAPTTAGDTSGTAGGR